MGFSLGARSLSRLSSLRSNPRDVIEVAITITPVDFTVLETMRTIEKQKALVASGASRTLKSKHLTGQAVDLGAWVGGEVRWDWPLYYDIARAVRVAAIERNMPITWGAVWDRDIRDMCGDLELEVANYHRRWRRKNPVRWRKGERPLMDGPHFEDAGPRLG